MKAEEIRKSFNYAINGVSNDQIATWQALVLVEIAAQLAELNKNLERSILGGQSTLEGFRR